MNRVATFNQFFGSAAGIAAGQANMAKAQQQTSTQKVSNDLQGFGIEAGRLLSAKTYAERLDSRAETLKGLQARADVEASALETAQAAVKQVREGLTQAFALQSGVGLKATIEQALSVIVTAANVQYNGEAVFGGELGFGEPFVQASLDTLAAQPNTDVNWLDTGRNRTVVIEDNRAIELSASAEELFRPFVDFLRSIRVWENANAPLSGKLTPAQQTYVQGLLPSIATVEKDLIDKSANAGITAKQLEMAADTNDARRDTLLATIGDQENVDLAEVATRLSAAETQYRASASVFSQLQDLNLLQYLR
jgi:flagellar hook-associated protein 3 FlgL